MVNPAQGGVRHRLARVCIAVMVVSATVSSLAGPAATAATPPAVLSLYPGPADVAGLESFSAWLGTPVMYGADFADHTKTWGDIANPSWFIGPWSSWKAAVPGRRMVVSVPLLTETDRGRFSAGRAGTFDVHFRTLAQNLVANGLGDSVVRLGWEMNNTSMPWYAGTDPAGYIAYYRRVVAVMRSVAGTSFTFDWCPLAGVNAGSPLTTFESFYPGDDVVDIIGLDNYDLKWQDTTSTPIARWQFQLTRTLGLLDHQAFAVAHGKPMSFPEWGLYAATQPFGGGGDNPYYIDRMADWFTANSTSYQTYFNLDWGGGTLESFPNGRARYKERFGPTPPPTTTTTSGASPTLSIGDVSITEGHSGTKMATSSITLSAASSQTVTVRVSTASGSATAGSDFVTQRRTVTFPAGTTVAPVSVSVYGDLLPEADETFTVSLSRPVNATIADKTGVTTIINDD